MSARRRTVRKTWLSGAMAVLLLAAGAGSVSAEEQPAAVLWAGFETGAAPKWSSANGVQVASTYAKSGSYGARAEATPDRPAYLKWSAPKVVQGQRYARIAGWIRIDRTTSNESIGLYTVKNGRGVNHFDLFRSPSTGRFQWDLYRNDSASSTMRAEVGKWYWVEALVDFGGPGGTAYTADVRINGVDQPAIRSEGQPGSTIRSVYFGENNGGKTNTRSYDSLTLVLDDEPQSFSW